MNLYVEKGAESHFIFIAFLFPKDTPCLVRMFSRAGSVTDCPQIFFACLSLIAKSEGLALVLQGVRSIFLGN